MTLRLKAKNKKFTVHGGFNSVFSLVEEFTNSYPVTKGKKSELEGKIGQLLLSNPFHFLHTS